MHQTRPHLRAGPAGGGGVRLAARVRPAARVGRAVLLLALAWLMWPAERSHADRGAGPYLYVFSSTREEVTVIDTASQRVLGTWPTGFRVMWLAGLRERATAAGMIPEVT